ncbi:hypothetical protein [Clostridium sp.]|uniref:hypothetical protein n=1 Tax=Clostridium sp. TaxID=1506 RepID=UPI001B524AE2|nr:hypothetical protein [Clostridium sp.]MBP3916073.1 hypothetical protein [Clostridium sp.]MBP3932062.1 hypothetical protein [Peptostreptococcaceae bacterium]
MYKSNKSLVGLLGAVILIILIPLIFNVVKPKNDEYEAEPELYVEQIWFKNIELLNDIPIDQSLLIQDEITYYFINNNKQVEKVELQEGSLKDLENGKLEFKAKYNDGMIHVKVNKDNIKIEE